MVLGDISDIFCITKVEFADAKTLKVFLGMLKVGPAEIFSGR